MKNIDRSYRSGTDLISEVDHTERLITKTAGFQDQALLGQTGPDRV